MTGYTDNQDLISKKRTGIHEKISFNAILNTSFTVYFTFYVQR